MATPDAARSSTHITRQVMPWHVVVGANMSCPKLGHRAESGGTRTFFTSAGCPAAAPAAAAGFACTAIMTSADAGVVLSAQLGLCSAPCKDGSGCTPCSLADAVLSAGSIAATCDRCTGNHVQHA